MHDQKRSILAIIAITATFWATKLNGASDVILPGQTLPNSITASAQTNSYTFTAISNDAVYLAAVKTAGAGNPTLHLYDPAGNAVFHGCGNGVSASLQRTLAASGNYRIEVTDCGTQRDVYDYVISFTKITCGVNLRELDDGLETILPGQTTRGRIGLADMDT